MVSVSPALSSSLGDPHSIIDLISEAQGSNRWWESFISSWGSFSLQAMPLFWERQGIIPFPAAYRVPSLIEFSLPLGPSGQNCESYLTLLSTLNWMVSLTWWTRALSLTAESLPLYHSFGSGYFILPWAGWAQFRARVTAGMFLLSSAVPQTWQVCAQTWQLPPLNCALISGEIFPL